MEQEGECSPCMPECRELDSREPQESLFAEGEAEHSTNTTCRDGPLIKCDCVVSCTGSTLSGSSLDVALTLPSSTSVPPNVAWTIPATSNCSSSPTAANVPGMYSSSIVGPLRTVPGSSSILSDSVDTGGKSTTSIAIGAQESSTVIVGQSYSGSSGGGRSQIRRLLRGRAHSSHGEAVTNNTNSYNSNCSSTNGNTLGEVRTSVGTQLPSSCRGRNTIGNIRNGRPSASKSTPSLLDVSSPCTPTSSSCWVPTKSGSAIWNNSNVFYSEAVSSGSVLSSSQPQQQLSAMTNESSASTSTQPTSYGAPTPHKTKNKVGSWALKLCKRNSPGNSNNSTSGVSTNVAQQGPPSGQGTSAGTLITYCSGAIASVTSSKSTNSSPSKGSAPLGYSGCLQGGLSASLPFAPPPDNVQNRYHYYHHGQGQHQHESRTFDQANNEITCACCIAGTSRDMPGGLLGGSSCNTCGIPAVLPLGTPNATRRRMATAIIKQLSSSSLEVNDGSQGSTSLGAFASLGGLDDLDERARLERAREIAEGVDPPPGFIRAHEVTPDGIAAIHRSLNLDALPWDVLSKIWDLNPSPHQISLSLAAATAGHGLSSGASENGNANSSSGSTVHTTVDYMHVLVPDLAQIWRCGFYWGKMDRYEAERVLQKKPEGSFLLRDSAQEEYLFSVSFRRYGRSLHARIEQWNHKFSFDSHDPGVFSSPTVCGLIEHYKDPACCMYFEPMLTIPINRNFPFSLQHLSRCAITERVNYDEVSRLHLPKPIKAYLREYHYKQRLRVRNVERE
ncbi:hypothetical protein BIW11_01145 [Tropilaelaps mercedesae]|uniref:Suppressor of cytokine signaling 5-like n=1 Tax=Tropilaelaps mercedesae TaxID=418985 RepID=A0A1V9XIQ5_9ACAR|nr:hypothetical protein BIW11_01145 [Tropilaelaps mercedesae]